MRNGYRTTYGIGDEIDNGFGNGMRCYTKHVIRKTAARRVPPMQGNTFCCCFLAP
ncbi:hypothetical protein CLOBOL_02043 [Enterocloster bolteae ATCC BAA-613]|uniref:Uncharacterized protein n=1 Tax=Enterocloster bolteae (strain ATCC BAA-613 / DSM 15670 / CCUG 46953 / JCM 12243 / WAL 16351) TaxID=411902 RepID=A8RMW3_ENTBW|nr:hypothetical protein CLOBOL_02043 [Enterocloster bolteae ATCC BAA-613]